MTASTLPADDRLPVVLLTGFLGSGKTTLLNQWLRSPDLADAAVIVNEFGEIGIDHALIASSSDNTIELSTGCLCCTVSGDLVNTLRELQVKRARGDVRPFDRVIIETTGLADPAPVIQTIMTFPVARRYRLNGVITAVDAALGGATLDRYPEAIKQVAVADKLVVTKTDMNAAGVSHLTERLGRLNPGAGVAEARLGAAPPFRSLATVEPYDPATKPADVAAWLNAGAFTSHRHTDPAPPHAHDHDHGADRHDAHIASFCLTYDEPLEWEHVSAWLDALVIAHGENLLRVKGIVHVAGRQRPIALHAVQHLFHPPTELPADAAMDRASRIVFITRDLAAGYVSEVFKTIRSRPIKAVAASVGRP